VLDGNVNVGMSALAQLAGKNKNNKNNKTTIGARQN
jgi:hypothetical protein